MIVWVDLETSGLDPLRGCCILEVACVVTEDDLTIKSTFTALVEPTHAVMGWDPFVVEMHTKNGLLEELSRGKAAPDFEVERALTFFLDQTVGTERKGVPLAGSSIDFDRRFLQMYMWRVNDSLSYRSINVSTIKELVARWHPALKFPSPEDKPHRALPDILNSIEELKYYKETVFVPSVQGVNA